MAVLTFSQLKANMPVGVSGGTTVLDLYDLMDTVEDRTTQAFLTKSASYTAVAADNRRRIAFNSASAVTLTLPSDLPEGWECFVIQLGAGQVTVAATGGAVRCRDGHTKLAGQYSSAYVAVYQNTGTSPQVILSGDTSL